MEEKFIEEEYIQVHLWILAEIGGLEFESKSEEEQGSMRSLTQIAISNQVQECDETLDPLLDQGVVEASGSFALLTFALEKVRADSSSF